MRVFDWGEDGGVDLSGPFLVLEYLGGGSLRDLLDRGHRLTPAQALLIGLEAAKGLDHAHRRGLVHRDIKPANLLFDDEGRLCVADFGVARALAEAAWTEPTGAVIGTARYASPEQAKGGSVDGRADVYALALVLVEAVTGQVPFAADTTIATLMGRADRPLEAPPQLGPLVPAIIAAGAVDPNERLDAAGFVKALDRAARDLDTPDPLPLTPARPETEITAVIDRDPTEISPVVVAEPATAAADVFGKRRRRWPWVLVAAGLAVLLAAGGLYAKDNVFVPSHAVPILEGKSLADARNIASSRHFKIHILRRKYQNGTKVDDILQQDPKLGTLKENRTIQVVVSDGPTPVAVPDLTGKTEEQAVAALREAGFDVGNVDRPFNETVTKGLVLDWASKGKELPTGSKVDLVVSAGPKPVTLSDWKGKPFDQAKAAMESVGFKVQKKDVFSDAFPTPGTVVSTSPGPGDVEKNATIVVSVSQGPETIEVPNVVGMNLDGATRRLGNAGFVVEVNGRVKGRVVGQDPTGGTKAKRGSVVAIALL
jgi:serine/threonine-protein kinase